MKKINQDENQKLGESRKFFQTISKDKWILFGVFLTVLLAGSVGWFIFEKVKNSGTVQEKLIENKEAERKLSQKEVDAFFNNQMITLYNQGNLKQLSQTLLEMLKTNPNDIKILIGLANVYAQESVYEYNPAEASTRARVYVEKALKIDPKNEWGLVVLGYTYEIEGNFIEAIKQYQKVLAINPNKGYYYTRLGHVLEMSGDYKGAVANYQKAIELTSDASAFVNMARLYGKTGRIDLAEEYYQKAYSASTNNEEKSGIYASLGSIYSVSKERTLENKNKAVEYLLKAVELNDKNSLAYSNLGNEYFKRLAEEKDETVFKENLKKIEEYFKLAVKINPNESNIYIWYGMTAIVLQKWQEAYDIFEVGLNKVEKDGRLFGQEKKDQKARFYVGQSILLAQDIDSEDNLSKSLEKLFLALSLNKNLIKDFIEPELKKVNGGLWYKVKDNKDFQRIVNDNK